MHEGGRGFRRSRLSRRVDAELVTHVGTEPVGRAQLFRDLHRQVLLETTLHVEHRPLVQLGQRLRLELPCFALDLRTLGVTLRADRGILAHGHGQGAGDAPATPSMRLAVDTMASSEPSTAARRHTDALHPAADASRSFLRDVRSGASADRAPAGADRRGLQNERPRSHNDGINPSTGRLRCERRTTVGCGARPVSAVPARAEGNERNDWHAQCSYDDSHRAVAAVRSAFGRSCARVGGRPPQR